MFVPLAGLLAAKEEMDEKASITICHTAQNLDNFIFVIDVSLLPDFSRQTIVFRDRDRSVR